VKGRAMSIGGFSLVEILVALVLLGLGLTGTTATLLLASRIQARAWREGELVQRAGEVADSVVGAGGGSGEMEVPGGILRWAVPPAGWGRVEALLAEGSGEPVVILEVHP
jgi:prepilin-type N-terminal cleavage/methylation domain-containing protein